MSSLVNQLGLFQLLLDGALLLCLVLLIAWIRRTPGGLEGRRILRSTEDFMAASEKLTAAFERNLKEKRALVTGLLQSLEQRTREMELVLARAEETIGRLDETRSKAEPQSRPDDPPARLGVNRPKPKLSDQERRVLELFRSGRSAAKIATELRLPKGEVELILGLHKRT
ncbi:MAG: hypothetical protein MI702_10945 [Chlorobiales bacterium]|nr:hypothetical protein [Chlorobiales bacterium]